MELTIGQKIKQMRKTNNRTQEQMAEALGVTPQAISRWEMGAGYPDISMIPEIANYFSITIDSLFGYDNDRNQKVRMILEEMDRMEREEVSPEECLNYIRLAASEFPAHDIITIRLVNALLRCGWKNHGAASLSIDNGESEPFSHPDYEYNNKNVLWKEALQLCENLIDNTYDADIREEALCTAAFLYWEFGDDPAVIRLAEKAPGLRASREMLLTRCSSGNYNGKAILTVLPVLSSLILDEVRFVDSEHRIRECQMIIHLYEFIFHDGNFGRFHSDMNSLYNRLTHYLWRSGKQDEAFEALKKSREHYDKFQSLTFNAEYRYTSVYTKGIVESAAEKGFRYGKSDNTSIEFDEDGWLSEEFCPGIRNDPRFYEITKQKK